MQASPHLARYGLRPDEVGRGYNEGEGQDLTPAPWVGPISEEERVEYRQWLESLKVRPEEDDEDYHYWNDPWSAYEYWPGYDTIEEAYPDFFPDQVGLEKLGHYDDWTLISLQAIDAYAEQVIQGEENDEWTAWIMDVMETGAFLREVFKERGRSELRGEGR